MKYKYGDLLNASEYIIAHGCNAQGKMGAGVAKLIANKWPIVYRKYIEEYNKNNLQLGSVIFVDVGKYLIANCTTQEYYGFNSKTHNKKVYVDYKAISSCFNIINNNVNISKGLALPLIGCGLAGGDWDIISDLINKAVHNTVPVVYVLK